MDSESVDHALEAANRALSGRQLERTASRFASIQLRGIEETPRSDRQHVIWEIAAVASIALAACLVVCGFWLL
ncbi:MAG TPA: hypothetical protein VHM70_10215 [Polyangiaceae bacterium]|jgi:hypothetical protein|nr:hypothetical protein [Polyangiaceae bacterium]